MSEAAWKLPLNAWDREDYDFYDLFDTSEANSTRLYMLVLYGLIRSNGWCQLVELGGYLGNTTAIFERAVRKNGGGMVHVYEVDAWRAAALRDRFAASNHVVVHQCRSQDAPPLPNPVDLVFVDSEHTYDGAAGDIACWAPRLKPGGLMAFHDITTDPDIVRAFHDAHLPAERLTFTGDNGLLLACIP